MNARTLRKAVAAAAGAAVALVLWWAQTDPVPRA